jgi:hypothetical protein
MVALAVSPLEFFTRLTPVEYSQVLGLLPV